ncbi:MAG: hypothetical protein KAR42_18180 [candidate division Zixibacteria bacterium]|nr:hypothetical protein [candidate division Zixibacteria bacterium]
MKQLNAIPYLETVDESEDIETSLVTYDHQRAYDGFNLWCPIGSNRVRLMDLQGKILHEWQPDIPEFGNASDLVLCENGDLLATTCLGELICVDWNSKLKWKKHDFGYHHEIGIYDNGEIFALGMNYRVIFMAGLPLPIRDDYIVTISRQGKTIDAISLIDILHEDISINTLFNTYWDILKIENLLKIARYHIIKARGKLVENRVNPAKRIFDNLHANTITLMNRDVVGLCSKGDMLMCLRNWDMICIFEPVEKQFIWQWNAGNKSRPHFPILLENNNILLFDNGPARNHSKIVEMNPFEKKIVWEYIADPPESFHSQVRGCSQKLPNGNILITESDKGRVFEITADGEIVWDFYNLEESSKKKNKGRAAIYRMLRITEPDKYPCLEKLKQDQVNK